MEKVHTMQKEIKSIKENIEELITEVYERQNDLPREAIAHVVYGLISRKVKDLESSLTLQSNV